MQNMNEDFDKIEKQINTPEIHDDERLSLEENILKQKVRIVYEFKHVALILLVINDSM